MALTFAAAGPFGALLALTAAEWVVIIVAIAGSTVIGQMTTFMRALGRFRQEKAAAPTRERTVAAEEAESALRIMGATIEQQHSDIGDLRTRVESCENRWREHLQVCPLGSFGRGGRRRGE